VYYGALTIKPGSSVFGTALVPVFASSDGVIHPTNTGGTVLTWNAVSGAVSYGVRVATDNKFTTTSVITDQKGRTKTTLYLTGLKLGTTYYYQINATNRIGTSAWSTASSFVARDAETMFPAATTLTTTTSSTVDVASLKSQLADMRAKLVALTAQLDTLTGILEGRAVVNSTVTAR
jgi:hypothetical protein